MAGMAKRIGGCTRGKRGWVRWYEGRTRSVCALSVPDNEVEDRWIDVKRRIDQDKRDTAKRPMGRTDYRGLLSAFLEAMELRVTTGKPLPLSKRMLHNYSVDLNEFGAIIGPDELVTHIGPEHFGKYVRKIAHLKASGYDSKVAHAKTLFAWAKENEYIDRPRYGSSFARPGKQAIRDQRIGRPRAYTAKEVATLINRSSGAMRPMLMLAAAAAMNNSEIAGLDRGCVDLEAGLVDFRRRKTGKVRRVIPLPAEVVQALKGYSRPDPKDDRDADLFFLTEQGNPYVRMTESAQANTITTLFRKLAEACELKTLEKGTSDGRGFSSLRTTFTNLAPPGYRDEVELLTGHAMGTILLDHYLETLELVRLRHVVDHVWVQILPHLKSLPTDEASPSTAPVASTPVPSEPTP